jgi:hypothetical protein
VPARACARGRDLFPRPLPRPASRRCTSLHDRPETAGSVPRSPPGPRARQPCGTATGPPDGEGRRHGPPSRPRRARAAAGPSSRPNPSTATATCRCRACAPSRG